MAIDIPIEGEELRQGCNRFSWHAASHCGQRQQSLLFGDAGCAAEGAPEFCPRAFDDILNKALGVEVSHVAPGDDRVGQEMRKEGPALGVNLVERGKRRSLVRQRPIRLAEHMLENRPGIRHRFQRQVLRARRLDAGVSRNDLIEPEPTARPLQENDSDRHVEAANIAVASISTR